MRGEGDFRERDLRDTREKLGRATNDVVIAEINKHLEDYDAGNEDGEVADSEPILVGVVKVLLNLIKANELGNGDLGWASDAAALAPIVVEQIERQQQ